MNGVRGLYIARSGNGRADQDVQPGLADGIADLFMMIIGNALKGQEEQVANEPTDITRVHWLGSNNFSDLKNLRVGYLFDLLCWYQEGLNKGIEDLSFNELVDTNRCQRLEDHWPHKREVLCLGLGLFKVTVHMLSLQGTLWA